MLMYTSKLLRDRKKKKTTNQNQRMELTVWICFQAWKRRKITNYYNHSKFYTKLKRKHLEMIDFSSYYNVFGHQYIV